MKASLPKDIHQDAIQVLGFIDGTAQILAAVTTGPVQSATFAVDTQVIRMTPKVDVYFKLGVDNTVRAAATDHFAIAGIPLDIKIWTGDANDAKLQTPFISVKAVSANGSVYLSERA